MRTQSMGSHRCVCGEPIARGEWRGGQLMSSGSAWVHGSVDARNLSRVVQSPAQARLDKDHVARLA